MPEVSRFYGISIRFFFRDHPPTHFHAFYGEFEAIIEIGSGRLQKGFLLNTALHLVNTWRHEFRRRNPQTLSGATHRCLRGDHTHQRLQRPLRLGFLNEADHGIDQNQSKNNSRWGRVLSSI